MRQPPKVVTVEVDSREQRVVPFPTVLQWWGPDRNPRLITVKRKLGVTLPTGDFRLTMNGTHAIVERKGSVRELSTNLLTDDWTRFSKVLDRMAEFKYKVIYLDFAWAEFWRPSVNVQCPQQVLDALIRETLRRDIGLLWYPQTGGSLRGETILRWFLGTAYWTHLHEEASEWQAARLGMQRRTIPTKLSTTSVKRRRCRPGTSGASFRLR